MFRSDAWVAESDRRVYPGGDWVSRDWNRQFEAPRETLLRRLHLDLTGLAADASKSNKRFSMRTTSDDAIRM